jgi:hypothetical protein
MVRLMPFPFDRVDEMTGQGTSGGHYRGAGHGGLGDSRAAKKLCGSLAAAVGQEGEPLFDRYSDLRDASEVSDRDDRQREERRRRRALELAATHFAAQATVGPPARDAGAHMGPREPHLALVRRARGIGGDGGGSELAHTPSGVDGGDAVQLGAGATSRGAHFSEREPEQASGRHGANSAARHDTHDSTLAIVQVGHQVGGSGEPVSQLESIEGVGVYRHLLSRDVELDASPRAKAGEVSAFAVATAAVIDR